MKIGNQDVIIVVIEPDGKEWHAYSPNLPGMHTCGDTIAEATANAEEAAALWLESVQAEYPDKSVSEIIEMYR